MSHLFIATVSLLAGCVAADTDNPYAIDNDGDGYSELQGDCDDTDAGFTYYEYFPDADGDGFGDGMALVSCASSVPSGYAAAAGDCDEADASVHPSASDICDGKDQDCDGDVDEDNDEDGFDACADCDDTRIDVSPAEGEQCNDGLDNDCDGTVDQARWYLDADRDGYGDPSNFTIAPCNEAPSGYLSDARDCDDTSASVHPDAEEICDAVDNDCDSATHDPDGVSRRSGGRWVDESTIWARGASSYLGVEGEYVVCGGPWDVQTIYNQYGGAEIFGSNTNLAIIRNPYSGSLIFSSDDLRLSNLELRATDTVVEHRGGSLVVVDSTIESASAAALELLGSGDVSLSDSDVAARYSGMYISGPESVSVTGSSISSNESSAIYVQSESETFIDLEGSRIESSSDRGWSDYSAGAMRILGVGAGSVKVSCASGGRSDSGVVSVVGSSDGISVAVLLWVNDPAAELEFLSEGCSFGDGIVQRVSTGGDADRANDVVDFPVPEDDGFFTCKSIGYGDCPE